MSIFSFLHGGVRKEGKMPIGAALDMLENTSRRFPYLVFEWIEANPSRAHKIEGLVEGKVCRQYKGWDGPYSITIRSGSAQPRIVNMFFQDLCRDVKVLCEAITKVGEQENGAIDSILAMCRAGVVDKDQLASMVLSMGVRSDWDAAMEFVNDTVSAYESGVFLGDDLPKEVRAEIPRNISLISIMALSAVSGEAIDRFPNVLTRLALYDAKSIALVGMLGYYGMLLIRYGATSNDLMDIYAVADRGREKERSLNREDFEPLNFNELTTDFLQYLQPKMGTLRERAEEYGKESYWVMASDIAIWIVVNLVKGNESAKEILDCQSYFANLMISLIAWDMCGLNVPEKA